MQRMTAGVLLLMLATVTGGGPAHGQDADLKDFISGTRAPLSLQMKDLTPEYRRVVVSGQSEMETVMKMMGAARGIEANVYFTRGETVELGGETYLLAYRPQMPVDTRVLNMHGHGEPPVPVRPNRNTRLALSLLNLRTSGSLNDVRPFDPKQDIQTTQESNAASLRNMTQLGQGIIQYIYQRGGKFPVMGKRVTPELKRAFYPFVHDARTYVHPATEQLYVPNSLLSGKRWSDIRNRELVWLFAEAGPANDGTRRILFADGHVESVSTTRWGRIQKVIILTNRARAAVSRTNIQYFRSKNGRVYYREPGNPRQVHWVADKNVPATAIVKPATTE